MASLGTSYRDNYVTPEQQLLELALPIAQIELSENQNKVENPLSVINQATLNDISELITQDALVKSLANEILRRSKVPLTGINFPRLIDLAIGELSQCKNMMAPIQTNWYRALAALDLLSEKIPPLPETLNHTLLKKCPIDPDKKIWETHSLYLIPAGTLNGLEARVATYAQQVLNGQRKVPYEIHIPNAFQLDRFTEADREKYGDIRFDAEWILVPNKVLAESTNCSMTGQDLAVRNLKEKSSLNYKIPPLRTAIALLWFHKVATGQSLFNAYNCYTRVEERSKKPDNNPDYLWVGGGGNPWLNQKPYVTVLPSPGMACGNFGVAPVIKL